MAVHSEVRYINTIGGEFASDELFLLSIAKGETNAHWMLINTDGPTPGGRYGHSICYMKPNIVLFGGYSMNEPTNDTWVLSIEEMPFKWHKVETKMEVPVPRVYHTASLCTSGKAAGMIVIFGGRGKNQIPLSDAWGLRLHRDGKWEWVKAPCNGGVVPCARYQVYYYYF